MIFVVSCLQRLSHCSPTYNRVFKGFLQTWQWLLQTGGPEDEVGWGKEAVPSRWCRSGQSAQSCKPGLPRLADFQAQRACVDWTQQQCGEGPTDIVYQQFKQSFKLRQGLFKLLLTKVFFFPHRPVGGTSGLITGCCLIPNGAQMSPNTTMAVCTWMWMENGRLHHVARPIIRFARGHQVRHSLY